MLALQVLDGAGSFYRPLEGRSLLVGSQATADLQLDAPGVAPQHFRLIPSKQDESSCQLEVLPGEAPVQVNGKPTDQTLLHLGDRIDVGGASLVLGQQLRRPATAEDVLQEPVRGASRGRSRSRSRGPIIAMILLLGLGGAAAVGWWSSQQVKMPYAEADQLRKARRAGDWAKARQVIASLRRDWAGQEPERLAMVSESERQVDEVAKLHAEMHEQVFDGVRSRNQFEALDAVKKRAKSAASLAEREAAALIAANFTEDWLAAAEQERQQLIADRRAKGLTGTSSAGESGSNPGAAKALAPDQPKDGTGAPAQVVPTAAVEAPAWLEEQLGQVRRLKQDGQYAQALETVRQMLTEVPLAHVETVRNLYHKVGEAAQVEMRQLIAKADDQVRQGQAAAGLEILRSQAMRFPTHGELSDLYYRVKQLEAGLTALAVPTTVKVAVPPGRKVQPAISAGDLAAVNTAAESANEALTAGDLELAIERMLLAAFKAQAQPALAGKLRGQVQDLTHLMDLSEEMRGKVRPSVQLQLSLADGVPALWRGMDEHRLVLGSEDNVERVSWLDVSVEELRDALDKVEASGPARLGFAVLCYRRGKPQLAERQLANFLRKRSSPGRRRVVHDIIRRGRGDAADSGGYTLVKGRFIAVEARETMRLAKLFHGRLSTMLSRSIADRDKVLNELRGQNDAAVKGALLDLRSDLIEKIRKSGFDKRLERLAAVRKQLDEARTHALDLIFDLKKYFYPFKPPAVSGARHSEYNKVQKEVDRRVAVVRGFWDDKRRIGLPKKLRQQIGLITWVDARLRQEEVAADGEQATIAWAFTLPTTSSVTIRNYCVSAAEQKAWLLNQRITKWNETLYRTVPSPERTQMRITNGYRRMMGRNPLAAHRALLKAARGHAEEMSIRGYFSHFSPVPARRTPYQRMALAGYRAGVSENIALNPSPHNAHVRWLHSSGHHRNILSPSHTEFAVGNTGQLWVQNYGRGSGVVNDPKFPPALDAR